MDILTQVFSHVCGQTAHTWAPGGELLPCCQRCTGLYAGALVAALLHGICRPRLSGHFLEVHGGFLLLMVPFGYHWLPQNAALRGVTGVLFGAGLVTFLQLPLLANTRFRNWREPVDVVAPRRKLTYFTGVLVAAWLVPWTAENAGYTAFVGLGLGSAAGALVLALLLLSDTAVLLSNSAKIWGRGGTRPYRMHRAHAAEECTLPRPKLPGGHAS